MGFLSVYGMFGCTLENRKMSLGILGLKKKPDAKR
jgi:hypothetical protein